MKKQVSILVMVAALVISMIFPKTKAMAMTSIEKLSTDKWTSRKDYPLF